MKQPASPLLPPSLAMPTLDAHARPPELYRRLYKKYQKISLQDLVQDGEVIDCRHGSGSAHLSRLRQVASVDTSALDAQLGGPWSDASFSRAQTYVCEQVEGLQIVPGLLGLDAQRALLDRLLHRDLADRRHQTNVGKHYRLPYTSDSRSFFALAPDSDVLLPPLDADIHKPISIRQFLNRKLRWVTLGGQYDWTNKVYPSEPPPEFPRDVAQAIHSVFPDMMPEAAICNLYTPGDTLSMHRDVSEESDVGLVSISIGCDALFIIGLDEGEGEGEGEMEDGEGGRAGDGVRKWAVIQLHSGDAVFMSGPARHAWHGVSQVIADTCPEELASWPAPIPAAGSSTEKEEEEEEEERGGQDDVGRQQKQKEGRDESWRHVDADYSRWTGWLRSKRINLNVRQMYAR